MFPEIAALLKANPLVAGGAGMAVVGWLMVQARSLPARLMALIKDQLSVSMTVFSEDKFFELLDLWLSRHPGVGRVRRFTVARWWNRSADRDEFALAPGSGLHIVREGWRFYFVYRRVEEKSTGEGLSEMKRRQTITVTTPGRSRAPISGLLDRIKQVHEDEDTIPVYVWNNTFTDFSLVERRTKRPMDTVYLEASTKRQIVEDVRWFLENRSWYVERGVPYRRGYMFEGPPGTGKTTLILALASLFNKAVYIISPSSIENDNAFQRAVSQAGSNFVVIEDIDSVEQAESRETKKKDAHYTGDAGKAGITLSGLLNAIDGIAARDGRLLFITTNRPDVLDAALLRPGRIDLRTHLGYSGVAEAREMFVKFFPDGDADTFCTEIEPDLPISPAVLQNRLLGLNATEIKAA